MKPLELDLLESEVDIANPDNQDQGIELALPTGGTAMPPTYRTDLENIPSYFKQFSPGNLPKDVLMRQRAMAQSGWEQAGRAIAGGLSRGAMTALEDLGYIGDLENNFSHLIGVDDLETNWLSSWAKKNKEKLSDRFRVYTEDPSKTFAWGDSGFYWSFLQEALTSAVGFGIPGLAVMGAVRGAIKFGQAYAGILTATSKANKATQLLSAYAMNVGEGKFMAMETYNRTLEELEPLVEKGEITKEELQFRANRAADRMFMLNRAMMLTDYLTVGGAMKALGMGGPKQSVFKQMLKEAPREAFEEIYQGTVDKTVSSLELQDTGLEARKQLSGTIVQSALDPNTLLEGLMGAVSGPLQMGIITQPQRAVSKWLGDSPTVAQKPKQEPKKEVDIENQVSGTVSSHIKSHAKAEEAREAGMDGLAAVETERKFLDDVFEALGRNEGYRVKAQLDAEREKLNSSDDMEALRSLSRLNDLFSAAAAAFDKHAGSPNQYELMSSEITKVYNQMTVRGLDLEIDAKTNEILKFLEDTGTPVATLEEALADEETADVVKGLEAFKLLESFRAQRENAKSIEDEANKVIRESSKSSNQKKARKKRKAEAEAQKKKVDEINQLVDQYEKETADKKPEISEEEKDSNVVPSNFSGTEEGPDNISPSQTPTDVSNDVSPPEEGEETSSQKPKTPKDLYWAKKSIENKISHTNFELEEAKKDLHKEEEIRMAIEKNPGKYSEFKEHGNRLSIKRHGLEVKTQQELLNSLKKELQELEKLNQGGSTDQNPGDVIYSIEDEDFDLDDILNNVQIKGQSTDEAVEKRQNTDRNIADKRVVIENGEVRVFPRRPSREVAWKLEKTKVVNGEHISVPQGLISEYKDNQITPALEGQPLTFVIDDNDNIPVYAPEWYTNVEAGLNADESQVTTWGELKKVLPKSDYHNFVPIRVEMDGKKLGYVHATEWVRTNDVAWNPAAETEQLSALRKSIVDKGGGTGQISFVSKGQLNFTGDNEPLVRNFNDNEVVIFAPKESSSGSDAPYFLTATGKKTPEELGVSMPESLLPGATYFIVENSGTKELVYAQRRGLSLEVIEGIKNAVRIWWKLGQGFPLEQMDESEKAIYHSLKEHGIDLKKASAVKDYLKPLLRNTPMTISPGSYIPAEIFLKTTKRFRKDSGVMNYEKNFITGGFGAGKINETPKSPADLEKGVFKIHRTTTKNQKVLEAELNKMGAVLGAMWYNVDGDIIGRTSPMPIVSGTEVKILGDYDAYIKTSHTSSLKPIKNESGDVTYTRQHIIEFGVDGIIPSGEVQERGASLSPIEAYHLRTSQQILFGPSIIKTSDEAWKAASEREFTSVLEEAQFWLDQDEAGMKELIDVYEKLRSHSPQEVYWGIGTPQARVAEAITGVKFNENSFGRYKKSDDDSFWTVKTGGAAADEVFEALINGDSNLRNTEGPSDITEEHIRQVLDAQMTKTAYNKQIVETSKSLRSAYKEALNKHDQTYLPKKYRVSPNLTLQTIGRVRRLYGLIDPVPSTDTYDDTPFSIEEVNELSPDVRTRIGMAIAGNIIAKVATEGTVSKSDIDNIVDEIKTSIQNYYDETGEGKVILDNFDHILEDISMLYVENSGVIKSTHEKVEEGEPEDTKSYDSLNSLQWNVTKTASQNVRKLLASIPSGTSYYGIQEYIDLEEAANTVFSLTAGNQDNFEGKMALLSIAKRDKPWLSTFIESMSNVSDQVKKQFTIATNNVGQDMLTAMFSLTGGGVSIELFDEGKFRKARNILKEWDRNLFTSFGIVMHKDAHYFTQEWIDSLDGKFNAIVERYNNLIAHVTVLHKTDKEAASRVFKWGMTDFASNELKDFYSHMGIVLTADEAFEIWKSRNGHQQLVRESGEEMPSIMPTLNTLKKQKQNWISGTYLSVKEAAEKAISLKQSIEVSNPVTNPGITGMRRVAIGLAEGSRLSSLQVQRVGNKNVPRLGMYSKLTEMAEKLANNPEERAAARKDKRLVNNIILNVLENEQGRTYFNISPHSLNALSQRLSKRTSEDFVNLTPADQEAVRIIGFFESVSNSSAAKEIHIAGNKSRRIYVLTPTISDKERIMAVTTYSLGENITNSPDGKLTDDGARDIANRMVLPEIIRAQEDGSHAANIFYSFRGLNETKLRNSETGLMDTTAVSDSKLTPEAEAIILPVIKQAIDAQVEATKDRWRDLDAARLVPTDEDYTFDQAVLDYEVNTTVFNAAYYQVFKADVADSYKSDPLKSTEQQITDTYNNLHKRLAADSAPGLTPAFDDPNEEVLYTVLDDTKQVSNAIASYRNLLDPEEASKYENIESADAQELVTLDEYLQLSYAQGRITKEDITEIPKILARSGKDIPAHVIGKLQPFKYVSSGIVQDPMTGKRKEIYIKSSIMPLIPSILGNSQLGQLADAMQKKGYKHAVYKSGLKLGSPEGTKKAFTAEGTLVDNIDEVMEAGAFTVPRRLLRLQQETPFKDKAVINRGTQETKLIFQGLFGHKDITYNYKTVQGLDVDMLFGLDTHMIQVMFEDLQRQFLREYLSKTGDILTSPEFLTLLKKEAAARNYPAADLDNIEIVDGKLRVPIWGADSSSRMYILMNSLLNSNILSIKMPGTSAVLGSDLGFTWKGLKEGEESDNFIQNNGSRIVFTENYDPETGLKPQRRVKKDKYETDKTEDYNITKDDEKDGNVVVLPAQIMLPNIFFTNDNKYKLDLSRYIKYGKLDTSKFDPALLQMMGFRVPTQGHSSMSYMEVVGILPEEHGNLVIAPKDFTKQMGSDFDIDKLYIYRYNIFETKNGDIKRYDEVIGQRNKKATIQNRFLDVRMAILSNPDARVQRQILSPLGEEKWEELADRYGSEVLIEPNSAAYQQMRVERAAAGSAGIGYFSQIITLLPLLERAHANGKTVQFYETVEEGRTRLIQHEFLGYEFKAELGLDNTVDGEGSRFKRMVGIQSASVDNENLQILHRIGVTPEAFNAVSGAIMAGASSELITLMLLQPEVQKLLKEEKLRRAIVSRDKKGYKELPSESSIEITKDTLKQILEAKGDSTKKVPKEVYEAAQNEAIRAFDFFEKLGSKMNTVAKSVNVDSKKLPKLPIEAVVKKEEVTELFESSPSLEDAIYGYPTPGGKFRGSSIFGIATYYGLTFAAEYFSRSALADSAVFKQALLNYMDSANFSGKEAMFKAATKAYNTLRAMSYRLAIPNETEIIELLNNTYDEDGNITHHSLGEIIQDLKRKGLENFGSPSKMYFLSQLVISQESPQYPVYIHYENAASDLVFGTQVKQSFQSMLYSNEVVGEYNGKEWTLRDVALALTKYSMGTGMSSSPISFSKFIPAEAKEAVGMTRVMYELVESQMRKGEANNLLEEMIISDPAAIITLRSIKKQDKVRETPVLPATFNARHDKIPVINLEDAPPYAVGESDGKYQIYKLDIDKLNNVHYNKIHSSRKVDDKSPYIYSPPIMKDTEANAKLDLAPSATEARIFSEEEKAKINSNKTTFGSGEQNISSLIIEAGVAMDEAERPGGRISMHLLERWQKLMPGSINIEVSPMKSKGVRGFYDAANKTIHINASRTKAEQAETLHHELLHVLSSSILDKQSPNYKALEDVLKRVRSHYGITQEMVDKIMTHLSEKNALSSRVLSNNDLATLKEVIPTELLDAKKGSIAAFIYALSSVEELIAHALTDETFMRAADNVEARSGFSLKQALIEFLSLLRKALLNLSGDKATALDEIIFYMDQAALVGAVQTAPGGEGLLFSAEEQQIIDRETKRCQ